MDFICMLTDSILKECTPNLKNGDLAVEIASFAWSIDSIMHMFIWNSEHVTSLYEWKGGGGVMGSWYKKTREYPTNVMLKTRWNI